MGASVNPAFGMAERSTLEARRSASHLRNRLPAWQDVAKFTAQDEVSLRSRGPTVCTDPIATLRLASPHARPAERQRSFSLAASISAQSAAANATVRSATNWR